LQNKFENTAHAIYNTEKVSTEKGSQVNLSSTEHDLLARRKDYVHWVILQTTDVRIAKGSNNVVKSLRMLNMDGYACKTISLRLQVSFGTKIVLSECKDVSLKFFSIFMTSWQGDTAKCIKSWGRKKSVPHSKGSDDNTPLLLLYI
jgi:hypothetical protein